jgi:hypothetical protein
MKWEQNANIESLQNAAIRTDRYERVCPCNQVWEGTGKHSNDQINKMIERGGSLDEGLRIFEGAYIL